MTPIDINTLFEYIKFNDAQELSDALKDKTVDPNCQNSDGWILLHIASKLGKLDCLRVLANNSEININIKGPARVTPLFLAIESKQIECVHVLLAHKDINVNICNSSLETPLHYSILNDRVEFAKLLVAHPRINLSAIDGNGKSARDLARECYSTNKEILQLLGVEGKEEDKLSDIATPNTGDQRTLLDDITHIEQVKAYLNNPDENGMTALHRAARDGDVEHLTKLLKVKGIDVNVQNPSHLWAKGYTPLHYAADNGHAECVKLLVNTPGINVNAQDKFLRTPLHFAAMNLHLECIQLLLAAKGINVNLKQCENFAALKLVEDSKYNTAYRQRIIDLLKSHGAM